MNQTQPKQPRTVYSNGRVAIGKDFIFTYVVLGENGWVPFDVVPKDVVLKIQQLMDHSSVFPQEVYDYVQKCLDDPNHAVVPAEAGDAS